jgi:hypothetical protein
VLWNSSPPVAVKFDFLVMNVEFYTGSVHIVRFIEVAMASYNMKLN